MMCIVLLTPFIVIITKVQDRGHSGTKYQSVECGFRAHKMDLCQSPQTSGKIMTHAFS